MSGSGFPAALGVLADVQSSVVTFIEVFIYVYILLIFAFILLSWIRLPYSPTLSRIQRFLYDVCDPYLRLFRRVLPPLGPLDLSPIVGIFVLVIVQRVLVALVERAL
jgi:YggT family protein